MHRHENKLHMHKLRFTSTSTYKCIHAYTHINNDIHIQINNDIHIRMYNLTIINNYYTCTLIHAKCAKAKIGLPLSSVERERERERVV